MRLEIDHGSGIVPYEQVRMQIASSVADGSLEPGERLPTVRQLAADLDLAVNTVARAFRELEADGVIETRGRRGSFVRSRLRDDDVDVAAEAARYAAMARASGMSLSEATRLLEQGWRRP